MANQVAHLLDEEENRDDKEDGIERKADRDSVKQSMTLVFLGDELTCSEAMPVEEFIDEESLTVVNHTSCEQFLVVPLTNDLGGVLQTFLNLLIQFVHKLPVKSESMLLRFDASQVVVPC